MATLLNKIGSSQLRLRGILGLDSIDLMDGAALASENACATIGARSDLGLDSAELIAVARSLANVFSASMPSNATSTIPRNCLISWPT